MVPDLMEFLIPSRSERPADDPIFALNAEAKARQAAGESIVNATVGALLDDEGRLAVLPTVAEVLRDVPPAVVAGYAPIAGPEPFLRAVTRDLLGSHAELGVSVATPGGSGALRHAFANFLEPHQSVLTTSFYWGPYKTLAEESERSLGTFRMFADDGRLDVADLERRLSAQLESQGRAVVVLNSPCHNPTGYSFDDGEWRDLATVLDRASRRGAINVVLDVAYAKYGAQDLGACLAHLVPLAGKVMLLFAWSASKSFTMYGLRVGAICAAHPDAGERRRVQAALTYSCRGTWSNCNAGGMAGIARILEDEALGAKVAAERAALKALLDRRVTRWNELAGPAGGAPALRYPRYDGGFFTTVFCEDAPAAAAALRAEGIFVVPQAGALRVALCSVAEADVPRLVSGLRRHASPRA